MPAAFQAAALRIAGSSPVPRSIKGEQVNIVNIFRNPCVKCLVQACCTEACEQEKFFYKIHEYIVIPLIALITYAFYIFLISNLSYYGNYKVELSIYIILWVCTFLGNMLIFKVDYEDLGLDLESISLFSLSPVVITVAAIILLYCKQRKIKKLLKGQDAAKESM